MKHAKTPWLQHLRIGMASVAMLQFTLIAPFAGTPVKAAEPTNNPDSHTTSPIKHVIVIIGENRSFDHVFATYEPKGGETVNNLLSEGIIKEDGTPGKNYAAAVQSSATDAGTYALSPGGKAAYTNLPAPLTGGPSNVCANNKICSISDAQSSENGLPNNYYVYMTTGGTGQASRVPDARIPNVNALQPGPFQLSSKTFPYDSYAASPVHRFYQMWQQLDCSAALGTCNHDLFPWVEVTIGAGSNGAAQAANFNNQTTGEGASSMGFYNVLQGDAPYLKYLADNYSMSDNYHQAVNGGTGANHIMMGTGDDIWFSDGAGNAAAPPENQVVFAGTPDAGTVNEIEDPNPAASTNNWYAEDGYGAGGFGSPVSGGGSYSNCSDTTAPGVGPIVSYLQALPRKINPNCDAGHYYILNNYNPGYFGDGSNASTDTSVYNTPFTVPPSSVRNIGDALLEKNISWKYYGDQWNEYLNDKYQLNYGAVGPTSDQYCTICNFFQYSTSIMTNAAVRTTHLKDTTDLYSDIQNGTLPAVSFVKPSGWVDGHPASSKLNLFEGFTKKIVDAVQANKDLWKDTAIFITMDEGGGYYDSGYVQPLDFFGDGLRVPMIVVSKYTHAGHISHDYTDHVSILKFIEHNWGINPLTSRSRDNYPNPQYNQSISAYVPTNSPAIGDLFDLFKFDEQGDDNVNGNGNGNGNGQGHDRD